MLPLSKKSGSSGRTVQLSVQSKINGQDLQDEQDKGKKNPESLVNPVQ